MSYNQVENNELINDYDFDVIENLLNSVSVPIKRKSIEISKEKLTKRQCLKDICTNKQVINDDKIQRRNERERNRVKQVNNQFEKLREIISKSNYCQTLIMNSFENSLEDICENLNSNKRLSKVKILRITIEYINYLTSLLNQEKENENLFFDFSYDLEDVENILCNSSINDQFYYNTEMNQTKQEKFQNNWYDIKSYHQTYNEIFQTVSDSGLYFN